MSLMKTLFTSEMMEETAFFETTYPLTNNFFNGDQELGDAKSEATAVVKTEISPGQLGRVRFQGVRWRACCDHAITLSEGDQVIVLGRRANILVVEPSEACIVC